MAFSGNETNLTLMATGNGFNLWHYKTNDTAAIVDSAQYFNLYVNTLNVGDMILAHADADGTPAFGVFVVLSNDGTDVDVGDLTDFAAADMD